MRQPQPDEGPITDQPAGAGGSDPATSPAPWRGSAAVPPPRPHQRWWQRDAPRTEQPPPRDPTLQLPPDGFAEDDPATRTPVDPWAAADPWPAGQSTGPPDEWPGAGAPTPEPMAFPPPVSPPAPSSPPDPPPPPVAGPHPPPPVAGPHPPNPSRLPVTRPPVTGPPAPTGKAARRQRRQQRRRRWPWKTTLFTLLTVACCCGCPAYYGKPLWDQYPANAALPGQVADLRLSDDGSSQETVTRLEGEMRTAHLLAEDTFAGVYRDGNGKLVVLYGITGFRMTPGSDLDSEVGRISDAYQMDAVETFETGARGTHLSCGTGVSDGDDVVVCAWADHGSLGTALFTRRSVEESATLTGQLRAQVISRE
ncbi:MULTISPECIES: hypothetical protein [unclassified Micromonospora]|uniref:hypothetical protein n=1 Tax=unclassified Micromonospora TaxID=2617518 RepID=UPI003A860CEA